MDIKFRLCTFGVADEDGDMFTMDGAIAAAEQAKESCKIKSFTVETETDGEDNAADKGYIDAVVSVTPGIFSESCANGRERSQKQIAVVPILQIVEAID